MARPMKQGLDYFPLNTLMNYKVDLVEAKYGIEGFGVIVKLYQKIFRESGYYCEWNEDVALQFAYSIHMDLNRFEEILAEIINRGILDKTLFDKYKILTSRGIQKRYCEGIGRRKSVFIKEEYLLLDIDDLPDCVVFDEATGSGYQTITCYEDLKGEDLRERLKKDFPRYNWDQYRTDDFDKERDLNKLFFVGSPDVSFAEYDVISHATSEKKAINYFNRLKRYPNAKNKFALVMTWICQDEVES